MMISFSEFVDEIVSEAASDEMVFQVVRMCYLLIE